MNPFVRIYKLAKEKGIFNVISDRPYVMGKYWLKMGHPMSRTNPQTYTEKINWLKLYDHNPQYIPLVDKWEVAKIVGERIGKEYIIPKLGVWKSVDEINVDALPDQFVLKCTNDSGGVVICRDKRQFDLEKARPILERSLKTNYYWHDREWPYKDIQPRILAEEYIEDASGNGLFDYKFFCFDGQPQFMFIATGRAEGNTCFDFFDMEFNWIPVMQHYPNAHNRPQKPIGFELMKQLAAALSKGMKHVRVDFFEVNGRVYFGELTFTHFGGYERFVPDEYDKIFGAFLDITGLLYENNGTL